MIVRKLLWREKHSICVLHADFNQFFTLCARGINGNSLLLTRNRHQTVCHYLQVSLEQSENCDTLPTRRNTRSL